MTRDGMTTRQDKKRQDNTTQHKTTQYNDSYKADQKKIILPVTVIKKLAFVGANEGADKSKSLKQKPKEQLSPKSHKATRKKT